MRPYIKSHKDLEEIKKLILKVRLSYQPFIFSDKLEVGNGLAFINNQQNAGMIYWPDFSTNFTKAEYPLIREKLLINNSEKNEFTNANHRLRFMYDSIVDQICDHFDQLSNKSIAEVGCNSGYLLYNFALRGSKEVVGYDHDDHTECFRLFNRLLGTNAKFIHKGYDLASGMIHDCPRYDLVISVGVLPHMTEQLRHLNFLDYMSKEALFILTNVWDDDCYAITFGEPNTIFAEYHFPWCFDNSIFMTKKLLVKSLELLGYTTIHEIEIKIAPPSINSKLLLQNTIHNNLSQRQLKGIALLGFKEKDGSSKKELKDIHSISALRSYYLEKYKGYELYTYGKDFYAIPYTLNYYDLSNEKHRQDTEVLSSKSMEELKLLIDETPYLPILVNSYNTYNIVKYKKYFFAIPQSLGEVNLTIDNHPSILSADTWQKLKIQIK